MLAKVVWRVCFGNPKKRYLLYMYVLVMIRPTIVFSMFRYSYVSSTNDRTFFNGMMYVNKM